MRIVLLGRAGGITHWLEDATSALRADGHAVLVGHVRRPWIAAPIEQALADPLADALAASVGRFAPDLILAIGGLHVPDAFLARLAALPGRPPLVGWVGDLFDTAGAKLTTRYHLMAYTDSGLLARHRELGLTTPAIFLPHAAHAAASRQAATRREARMVFVANATPGRRVVVEAITRPIAVYGPGWTRGARDGHDIHPGRTPHAVVAGLYARHMAALNVRNEINVLRGLNQRSFDPYLVGTPVVTDDQADLGFCFDPGSEVLVWRDTDELNALHERLLGAPDEAVRVGEAGRQRVLADHTFARRLRTLMDAL